MTKRLMLTLYSAKSIQTARVLGPRKPSASRVAIAARASAAPVGSVTTYPEPSYVLCRPQKDPSPLSAPARHLYTLGAHSAVPTAGAPGPHNAGRVCALGAPSKGSVSRAVESSHAAKHASMLTELRFASWKSSGTSQARLGATRTCCRRTEPTRTFWSLTRRIWLGGSGVPAYDVSTYSAASSGPRRKRYTPTSESMSSKTVATSVSAGSSSERRTFSRTMSAR